MAKLFSLLQMSPVSWISVVMTQPVSTVSAGEHCPCASPTSSLFPPVTSGTQIHPSTTLSSLFGRGWNCLLDSCPRILWQWWAGTRLGIHALVSGILPSQSNLLTVCFSMSSTIFASNIHICWDSVGYSFCSSEYQLGVLPACRGTWTPLSPTSPPSSNSEMFIEYSHNFLST